MQTIRTYFLKRPGGARRSFAIQVRVTCGETGARSYESYRGEDILALNAAFRARSMDAADAEIQAEAIVKRLNEAERIARKGTYVSTDANRKLLNSYWEKEYVFRKLTAPDAARERLERAIEALGPKPLLGDRRDLQKHIDQGTRGNPRKQRRIVSALNQMRRHFGITEKLAVEKMEFPEFRYLTEDELHEVLTFVSDPTLKLLFQVLFYSGVRLGEAMGLRLENYRKGALFVDGQIDKEGRRRGTKTNRVRRTAVYPNGQRAMEQWLKLPVSAREVMVRQSLPRVLKEACARAFPGNETKQCTPKDLRHSFAVLSMTRYDASVGTISKMLGNSVQVCETYYLRFVMTDDLIGAVLERARLAT